MSSRTHDNLIDQLVSDAAPVRPMPPVRVALAGVAALWIVTVASLSLWVGLRPDLMAAMSEPLYGAVFLGLVATAFGGALAGLAAAMPGREELSTRSRRVGLGALIAAAAVCLVDLLRAQSAYGGPGSLAADADCMLHAALFSVVPVAGLLAYLLRGWVGEPVRAAGAALVGGLAFGGAAVHLVCGIGGARHLLLGHLGAPVLFTAALAVPLAMLLRRVAR